MRTRPMTDATVQLVADRFKALAEPARLRVLQALRNGERTVTDLERLSRLNQANLSRHLRVLAEAGLVRRRKHGLFVYYQLADKDVLRLCEIMCGRGPAAG